MTEKICTLLGFASKAGALRFGSANTIETVKRHRAKGVFYAVDLSEKSKKELLFFCDKFGAAAFELKHIDMEKLSKSVGKRCAAVAVTDESFANSVISNLISDV